MEIQQTVMHKEEVEIYNGEICRQKSLELLEGINLPKGLFPFDDITEVGLNHRTGFVWLRLKEKKQHKFRSVGRTCSYETEITAFVENKRMRRVTGIKSKEFLIWVTLSDIYIDDRDPTKIIFGNPTGLTRSYPVSAFESEEKMQT